METLPDYNFALRDNVQYYIFSFQIVKVAKNREGFLDLVDLEKKLSSHMNSQKHLVGFFSAASRLTGILTDDVATTILLHQYGALAIWDYSMVAPYSEVNMNPQLPGASKDIVYFNVNKFIGGVQAPGESYSI